MYDHTLGFWGIGRKIKKAAKKIDPKKLGEKFVEVHKKGFEKILAAGASVMQPPLTQPPAEIPQQEPPQDFVRSIINSPFTIPALIGVGALLYFINRK